MKNNIFAKLGNTFRVNHIFCFENENIYKKTKQDKAHYLQD